MPSAPPPSSHLARLRERPARDAGDHALHLDVLRDLKRIHSHICSVAYPVLEAAGEMGRRCRRERSDHAGRDGYRSLLVQ